MTRKQDVVVGLLTLVLVTAGCSVSEERTSHEHRTPRHPPLKDAVVRLEPNVKTPYALDGSPLDEIPEMVRFERPEYPDLARAAGVSGRVYIEIIVDKHGDVEEARVVFSTAPMAMDESVLKAAQKWKYRPASKNGKPVSCRLVHGIHFEVDEESILR